MSPQKIVVFSDFDGTISMCDTGNALIDACMGLARRMELDEDIIHERRTFRDAVREMWRSVTLDEAGVKRALDGIIVDPDFAPFLAYCDASGIPVTVLSSGLDTLVNPMLRDALGERAETLMTVTNRGVIDADGVWDIEYIDSSPHGHDKAASMTRLLAEMVVGSRPLVVFVGDGVSDIQCARKCDRLYVKRGLELHKYCLTHDLPHVPFDTFANVLADLKKL
ncbi:HAD-like domain-containing protein [Blastocladiella britannica]|nr:HAD-like domain-containing protein [Blastocladiella britannica]